MGARLAFLEQIHEYNRLTKGLAEAAFAGAPVIATVHPIDTELIATELLREPPLPIRFSVMGGIEHRRLV